jgi:hypothetical protein
MIAYQPKKELSRHMKKRIWPESHLLRRERFYAALGTGTIRSGTVDSRLSQADSSTMSDLMRVEEALRLRCRMHIHLCVLHHCRFFSSELQTALLVAYRGLVSSIERLS